MQQQRKTAHLTARISPQTRQAFVAKARKYGAHTEVLRELIEAFTEGRLTIKKPAPGRSSMENLYE